MRPIHGEGWADGEQTHLANGAGTSLRRVRSLEGLLLRVTFLGNVCFEPCCPKRGGSEIRIVDRLSSKRQELGKEGLSKGSNQLAFSAGGLHRELPNIWRRKAGSRERSLARARRRRRRRTSPSSGARAPKKSDAERENGPRGKMRALWQQLWYAWMNLSRRVVGDEGRELHVVFSRPPAGCCCGVAAGGSRWTEATETGLPLSATGERPRPRVAVTQ